MKATLPIQSATYHEKITWASLAVNLTVWLPYFSYVSWLFSRHAFTQTMGWTALIGAIVLLSLLHGATFIGIERSSPKEPADERDDAVASKALRNAYYVVLFLLGLIVFSPMWWQQFTPPGLTHQLLLGCYVTAETVRLFSRGWYYRYGF
jgi:hypothetical protein